MHITARINESEKDMVLRYPDLLKIGLAGETYAPLTVLRTYDDIFGSSLFVELIKVIEFMTVVF